MRKCFLWLFVLFGAVVTCQCQDLSRALLQSTVQIFSGQDGRINRTGTGFFYEFDIANASGAKIPVLVTCRHVVEGCNFGMLDFGLASSNSLERTQSHFRVSYTNWLGHWLMHPDTNVDIAVLPLGPVVNRLGEHGKFVGAFKFQRSNIPSEDDLKKLGVFESVNFIGYPIGVSDRLNNLPISRVGMTATDLAIDYEGLKCFLIDAAVWPGSSGSPVIIYDSGAVGDRSGLQIIRGRPSVRLLGIVDKVIQRKLTGEVEMQPVPTALAPEAITSVPANLGVVIKAEVLDDFLPQIRHLVGKE